MTIPLRRAAMLVAGALCLQFLAGATASADLIVLKSGDLIPGTVWDVSFPKTVSLVFNTSDTTNSTAGTLIETTARTDNSAITIHFQQDFETPLSKVGGGLRLNLQKTDTNAVGPAWVGYEIKLVDLVSAPNDPQSDEHPPEPHFHPKTATFIFGDTFTGADVKKYRSSFLGDSMIRNPVDTMIFGDGGTTTVPMGRSVQMLNLLIHERQFPIGTIPDPGRRTFDMIETPILAKPAPEPGSLCLGGIGVATLGLFQWWRNRRAS